MTKEQENTIQEAIKICEHYKNILYACNCDEGTERTGKAIETVLNMLKRQQIDIQIYEEELDKIYKVLNIERGVAGLEVAEIIKTLKNTVSEQINMLKEKDKELKKKDKIIDLMAYNLADYVMYYEYDKCRNPEMIKNKAKEIKQYFERKVNK